MTHATTHVFNPIDAAEHRRGTWMRGLGLLLIVTALAGICVGPVAMTPLQVMEAFARALGFSFGVEMESYKASIIMGLRLPRVLLAIASGAALGIAGAVLQGLFRNPLADPGLIGISSGAALAAVVTIVLGASVAPAAMALLGAYALPIAAFGGSVIAAIAVLRVASIGGTLQVSIVLLAGIAINALAAAGIGYMMFISTDQQLRDLTFWTLGSFASASWTTVIPAIAAMGVASAFLLRLAPGLNALLLGEAEAYHLGIDVHRLKLTAVIASALAVGAGVALTGVIAFVGLVVPHLVRMMLGPDHKYLLPGSMMLGAALLALTDLIARMAVIPAELPIGVVTSAVGAPFFIWLLVRKSGYGFGGG